MAQQLDFTMNEQASHFERTKALADFLEQAIAEADSLGLGVVALKISIARDHIELDSD
jgi:hypothetical protein